ncbi:hypothetical protein PMIN07_010340 [Paraphaeosphaeria minitans]
MSVSPTTNSIRLLFRIGCSDPVTTACLPPPCRPAHDPGYSSPCSRCFRARDATYTIEDMRHAFLPSTPASSLGDVQPGLALFASCSRHLCSEELSNTSLAATLSSSRHPLQTRQPSRHTPDHSLPSTTLLTPLGTPCSSCTLQRRPNTTAEKLLSIRTAHAMAGSRLAEDLFVDTCKGPGGMAGV